MSSSGATATLLQLVSRGNAIIAELRRLGSHIPIEFQWKPKDHKTTPAISKILVDAIYFQSPSELNNQLLSNAIWKQVDEDLRSQYSTLMMRFYAVFESVLTYYKDLLRLIKDLEEGLFVQESLETVLADTDSKQYMSEAVFLHGALLLHMDTSIDGIVRERILVAYHRWMGVKDKHSIFDEICRFCSRTNLQSRTYIEELFSRLPLPDKLVHILLGTLRTEAIYGQVSYYPLPEHRSAALAAEASIIVLLLFFVPNVLRNDAVSFGPPFIVQGSQAKMREIVDKHFPDNWVVSVSLWMSFDLSSIWFVYPAAKAALQDTISKTNIMRLSDYYVQSYHRSMGQLEFYLMPGRLNDIYVLDNVKALMECLRSCNVCLRWLLLHTHGSQRSHIDYLMRLQRKNGVDMISLMLSLAQFEFVLKNIFERLFSHKIEQWNEYKRQGVERMTELSEFFSGDKPLTRVSKNASLTNWFANMAKQIDCLNVEESTASGRRIVQLVRALEEVEQFHQLETNVHILRFLEETRTYLGQMLRLLNVKEKVNVTLSVVSDASYSWNLIDYYIPHMQRLLQKDPSNTVKLRSIFYKLTTMMNLTLTRINQANSPDLVSVSQFYSSELVRYIRNVLQIIPNTMFQILDRVIDLQTNHLPELPKKIERAAMHTYEMLNHRAEFAKCMKEIAQFTQGILAMEVTLVGVIEVDPKELLETGIRTELKTRLQALLNKIFYKPSNRRVTDYTLLDEQLHDAFNKLKGFSRAFELIQDYMCISASKLWQEEFQNLLRQSSDVECDQIRSQYKYETPTTFMGRICSELIQLSSNSVSFYNENTSAWISRNSQSEIVTLKTFRHLQLALGGEGGKCLLRILGFHSLSLLRLLEASILDSLKKREGREFILTFEKAVHPNTSIPLSFASFYKLIASSSNAIFDYDNVGSILTDIGQVQLLQYHLANIITAGESVEQHELSQAFGSLERLLMTNARNAMGHGLLEYSRLVGRSADVNNSESSLYSMVNKLTIHNSLNTTYPVPLDDFIQDHAAEISFVILFALLPRYSNLVDVNRKNRRAKYDNIDLYQWIVGLSCFLQQLPPSQTERFSQLMDQYARSWLNSPESPPVGVDICQSFWATLSQYSNLFDEIHMRAWGAYL